MRPTPRHIVAFQTTHLSEIRRAESENPSGSRPALGELLVRYIPPLTSHLIFRRRYESAAAEDVVQQFVADQILENRLLADYDQQRGKFRSFLLTCLDRFAINLVRHDNTARRSPGKNKLGPLPDEEQVMPQSGGDMSTVFDKAWAESVLGEALKRTEAGCVKGGHDNAWIIFNARVVRPALDGTTPPGYGELMASCQMQSPTQAANVLVTAKRMFQRTLREVLADFGSSSGEIDQEVSDLLSIFAAAKKPDTR